MVYNYIKSKIDDKTFLIYLIVILIFFIFILPFFDSNKKTDQFDALNESSNLSSNLSSNVSSNVSNGIIDNTDTFKIDEKICSKQCCKHVQWPVNFNTANPNISDTTLNKFINTNFTCAGGNAGGCVCMEKKDYNYLGNHGNQDADQPLTL